MFRNLNELMTNQYQKLNRFFENDNIYLTNTFISEYTKALKINNNDNLSVDIKDGYTRIVKQNNKVLFFPNQWYYIAYLGAPIYSELHKYKEFIVNKLNKNTQEFERFFREAKRGVLSENDKIQLFENLSEIDKKYLEKFLIDYNWWHGGKTIDRNDFFISPILATFNQLNDSTSYIANMSEIISTSEKLMNIDENNLFSVKLSSDLELNTTDDQNWIQKYKDFLKNQQTINSDHTIYNYVRYLKENYIKKIQGISKTTSIFNYKTKFEFEEINNEILSSSNFNEINSETNGALKCTLQYYGKFLDFINTEKIETYNIIYFGAPGTGKSYNVSKLVKEYYPDFENEENEQSQFVFRTTLHPEYTYSDFVGQIMPVTKDDKIDYDFIPGVFTRALEKAISFEQTNQKVFLILEELSRANVASVFGDLFQLLDRKNGKSEYPISNSLIAKEVFHSGPLKNEDGSINKENERLQNKKIYLPSNLYILCTVNTSDQNVFVMDTAFKRRFDWIPVLTDPVKDIKTGDYINNPEITIDGVKLKWCEFYPILNNYITSKMGLSEDKQIGQFFIKFDDNSSTEVVQTLLKNKLLQYLWDDVENAAYSKKLFEGITSFSELYKKFGVTQIFNAELITALNNIKNSDIEMTNDNQSIELNNNVELDENLVAE